MRLTKQVYKGPGGSSMQDLEMSIFIEWNQFEIQRVPIAVRNAISAIIHIWQHRFKENTDYAFSVDTSKRPCLTLGVNDKFTKGESLAKKIKFIWDEHLGFVNNSNSDKLRYDAYCHQMGSQRIFLRRLELLDALLRVNFYTDNFWKYRANWTSQQFINEVHEPNEMFGFPYKETEPESAVR